MTTSPDRRLWIDGRLVPWAEATVHVLSHSHQRGSLVFDYMSVYETPRGPGRVPAATITCSGCSRSVEMVGLPLRYDAARDPRRDPRDGAREPGREGGEGRAPTCASVEVDVVPVDDHVTLAIAAYDPMADVCARKGVSRSAPSRRSAIWIEKERKNRRPDILPPQAKVAAQLHVADAREVERAKRGYDEILLVDEQGYVAEGPTSNVFLVDRDGTRCARRPRRRCCSASRGARSSRSRSPTASRWSRAKFRPEALFEAAEAFLTGTTAGVWPIASVDDHALPAAPGPGGGALGAHFRRIVQGEDPAFVHWLVPAFEDRACGSSPASSPRARPHLGNYFGAMRQHVALQDEGEAIYFVADYHSMTSVRDARASAGASCARWRSTTSRAGSTRSARCSTASRTCPRRASSRGCSRR